MGSHDVTPPLTADALLTTGHPPSPAKPSPAPLSDSLDEQRAAGHELPPRARPQQCDRQQQRRAVVVRGELLGVKALAAGTPAESRAGKARRTRHAGALRRLERLRSQ